MFYFNFGESIPNVADIVQAVCATLTTLLAFLAYYKWRSEKNYEIYLDMKSKLPVAKGFYIKEIYAYFMGVEKYKSLLQHQEVTISKVMHIANELYSTSSGIDKEFLEIEYFTTLLKLNAIKKPNKDENDLSEKLNRILKSRNEKILLPIVNLTNKYENLINKPLEISDLKYIEEQFQLLMKGAVNNLNLVSSEL